jgi:hypothetical protein
MGSTCIALVLHMIAGARRTIGDGPRPTGTAGSLRLSA